MSGHKIAIDEYNNGMTVRYNNKGDSAIVDYGKTKETVNVESVNLLPSAPNIDYENNWIYGQSAEESYNSHSNGGKIIAVDEDNFRADST